MVLLSNGDNFLMLIFNIGTLSIDSKITIQVIIQVYIIILCVWHEKACRQRFKNLPRIFHGKNHCYCFS